MSAPTDPWFQSLFADRIGGANYGKGTEIYKFEKIKRAKRAGPRRPSRAPAARLRHRRERRHGRPSRSARRWPSEVDKLENRGYADNGIAAFKEAAAGFMKRQFGVTLDPATEINHAIGSKPAFAMLPACFINPGDVTLMTVPGYPVAGTHTRYYGGEVHNLPLLAENGFFPDLDGIPADIRKRAKLLVINYPNSPTGAVATRDFYSRVIDFAHTNQVVVVQDAAHILLTLRRPAVQLPAGGRGEGGRRRGAFDVEGLQHDRLAHGFVAGHAKIVQAFADVKDNSDSGQFMAIQQAAGAGAATRRRSASSAREVPAAPGEARRGPEAGRLHRAMPGGTYFLYATRAEGRRRPDLRQRRGSVAVPDPRAVDLLRAVGRRRAVPALLGDLQREGRARRGWHHGRDGGAAEGDETPVLIGSRDLGGWGIIG